MKGKVILELSDYELLKRERECRREAENKLIGIKRQVAEELRWAAKTKPSTEHLSQAIFGILKNERVCMKCGEIRGVIDYKDPKENAGREFICIECLNNTEEE